jgi:hypothetical protein
MRARSTRAGRAIGVQAPNTNAAGPSASGVLRVSAGGPFNSRGWEALASERTDQPTLPQLTRQAFPLCLNKGHLAAISRMGACRRSQGFMTPSDDEASWLYVRLVRIQIQVHGG